jgi:hypothetical protein
MKERQRPSTKPKPADAPSSDDEGAEALDEPESSKEGPGSLDWWLKDGPDSPIAADIEQPEKHL